MRDFESLSIVLTIITLILYVFFRSLEMALMIAKQPPLTKGKRLLQLYSWKGRPASSFFVIITYSNYF